MAMRCGRISPPRSTKPPANATSSAARNASSAPGPATRRVEFFSILRRHSGLAAFAALRNDELERLMQFDSKIAVVVRSDLEPWQKLNVASFLAGGIAAAFPACIGDAYEDRSGTKYLSLIGQPT